MKAKEMLDKLLRDGSIKPHEHIALQLQIALETRSAIKRHQDQIRPRPDCPDRDWCVKCNKEKCG